MSFPLDNPIFRFLYWLVNTPGLGGLAVGIIFVTAVSSVGAALRWIVKGAKADEADVYAYPTPALHHPE